MNRLTNIIYPLYILIGFILLGVALSYLAPNSHETKTVVRYQNNFTTDTTAICDSLWHDYGHKPVPDHVWEEIVIIDKPF